MFWGKRLKFVCGLQDLKRSSLPAPPVSLCGGSMVGPGVKWLDWWGGLCFVCAGFRGTVSPLGRDVLPVVGSLQAVGEQDRIIRFAPHFSAMAPGTRGVFQWLFLLLLMGWVRLSLGSL